MIRNLKNISLKKAASIIIGLLVALGFLGQSDFLTNVLQEGGELIPEDVTVSDILPIDELSDEQKYTSENVFGPYMVTKIADGDTFTATVDGTSERIRLLGIDTPETAKYGEDDECYALEAHAYLASLLSKSAEVYLEYDESQGLRDTNDRLLAYVYVKNSNTESLISINQTLIAQGYAYEYTYNKPYVQQRLFKAAEKEAQDNLRGVWAVCE